MPSRKIYLAQSKIKKAGRGVFAEAALKKGEVIELCPIILLQGKDIPHIKKTELYNYYFVWHSPKKVATKIGIALGFGSLYNHSYTPSATYVKKLKENIVAFVAIKNIAKGEEIMVNYNYSNPNDQTQIWIKSIKPPNL